MFNLKLVPYDSPLLRIKTAPFDFEVAKETGFDTVAFKAEMVDIMRSRNGIGLSANQVGSVVRAFVLEAGDEGMIFFNPRLVDVSETEVQMEEGCLSFPGISLKIKRPQSVRVRYEDEHGETHTSVFAGLSARCVLHEIDHLDGKTFVELASALQFDLAKNKAAKLGLRYDRRKCVGVSINQDVRSQSGLLGSVPSV
jgi:peptide deformylase